MKMRRWYLGWVIFSLGCTSHSIAGDVSRVQRLAQVERLPHVADTAVVPAADEEARQLLEQPLDVDAAVRIATLNNRALRASLRELGITRGRMIQAGLLPNPSVEVELLPERNTQLELRLEYDLTQAIMAPMRGDSWAPELEAARYRTAGLALDVIFRTRAAFYKLQACTQRLALAQQLLDVAAADRDAARAIFEAGNSNTLALSTQEVAYERSRVMVAELELEVALAREQLQILFGAHAASTRWQLAPSPLAAPSAPPPDLDDLERDALSANFTLKESKYKMESIARRIGVERLDGWLPEISLDVHGLQGDPTNTVEPAWQIGAGVSVGLPLFDRHQGTTLALEAEFDAHMERYHGIAVTVRSNARQAAARLASAHALAAHYETKILPKQRQRLDEALLQYNAMQIGVFELLDIKKELIRIEMEHVKITQEYWTAIAALDALRAGQAVSSPAQDAATTAAPTSVGGH